MAKHTHKKDLGNSSLFFTTNWILLFILISIINLDHVNGTPQRKGASSPDPTKVKVTTSSKWIQESVDSHNYFRSLHGAPPLVLNNTLSEISQYYANYLLSRAVETLDSNGYGSVFFDHNPQAGKARIGENLYYSIMNTPVEPIPSPYAVLLWYEEIKDYDFSTAKRQPTSDPEAKIGHLTQLLWKSTLQMGTAYASKKFRNNNTVVFVVANYYPQGNIILHGNEDILYLQNVLPATLSDADINAKIVATNVRSWWNNEPKSKTSDGWRQDALKKYNEYRSAHGSQNIRLNDDICMVSQLWAEHLLEKGLQAFNLRGVVNQIEGNFIGTRVCNLGESSMFYITPTKGLAPDAVIKVWYKERNHYNFDGTQPLGKNLMRTDGFEQIVWNTTTEFCISYATKMANNGQYMTYVVANYYPPKAHGYARNNVFPGGTNVEEDEDPYVGKGCCSIWVTLLIILGVSCLLGMAGVAAIFAMKKFKYGWYRTLMEKRPFK